MTPNKKTARLAGLLFLLTMVFGLFAELFFRQKLFVANDAAATAVNILSNVSLYLPAAPHVPITTLYVIVFGSTPRCLTSSKIARARFDRQKFTKASAIAAIPQEPPGN